MSQLSSAAFPEGVKPSKVFPTYWRFAHERQEVYLRKLSGMSPPWTLDPIISKYRFTNPYRASDRVSQFLIRNVLYSGSQEPREVFFRCMLFNFFKKPSTWTALLNYCEGIRVPESLGVWMDHVDSFLANLMTQQPIYTAAYVMPAAGKVKGVSKHRTHLQLLSWMMEAGVPERLTQCRTLFDAFQVLQTFPIMGDFLAMQYVTDLNYSGVFDWPEDFVVPGPGARSGIRKCFEATGRLSDAEIIQFMRDTQETWFSYYQLPFRSLWGRRLQLIDCQNLFCETNKYAREAHPDVMGTDNCVQVKQKYSKPDPAPMPCWFPPKWGINEKIYPQTVR